MINISRTSIFLTVDRWHVELVAATPRVLAVPMGVVFFPTTSVRSNSGVDGWNCNFLQHQALGVSHVEL